MFLIITIIYLFSDLNKFNLKKFQNEFFEYFRI